MTQKAECCLDKYQFVMVFNNKKNTLIECSYGICKYNLNNKCYKNKVRIRLNRLEGDESDNSCLSFEKREDI